MIVLIIFGCQSKKGTGKQIEKNKETVEFPTELVNFIPYENNPVFTGTGTQSWDKDIRERGYILRKDSLYHLWYSGYNKDSTESVFLGYATSSDGLQWTRYPHNPIFNEYWVEDMQVVIHKGIYYMFAEGKNDIAQLLTSKDGVQWKKKYDLDIRKTNGEQISEGPFGTTTVWIENDKWYLFYERNDSGIWLAVSTDLKQWVNVQDKPVLNIGPEQYDQEAVAMNQIIKHKGRYYAYYHGTGHKPWKDWTTNIAMSEDLINWKKYPKNPIVSGDKSSGILVYDGAQYRLYTMHPDVRVYFPKSYTFESQKK